MAEKDDPNPEAVPQSTPAARLFDQADIRLVIAAFVLNVLLVFPLFTPHLSNIGEFDEANYIVRGSSLSLRNLPDLNQSPAVALFYAITYVPVRGSDFWMVYSGVLGRFLLFSMLWMTTYLAARKLTHLSSPWIIVGLLLISPTIESLSRNGSHALFTVVSTLSLTFMLAFHREKRLQDLWIASALVGLSLLCRVGEGTLLSGSFILISGVMGVVTRNFFRTLQAAVLPCVAIVGGYMLSYFAINGTSPLGGNFYLYLAFEEGHGMAYRDRYPGSNFFVEGAIDARKLFGTAEENQYSVIAAIRRNPSAYFWRVPLLAKAILRMTRSMYGGPLSLWLFLMALQGLIELIRRREYLLVAIFFCWLSYFAIYILLVFQESHLLIPFPVFFCLAAVGITSIVAIPRTQQYAWLTFLAILAVAVAAVRNMPLNYMFSTIVLMLTLWIVWTVISRHGSPKPVPAMTLVFLFCMSLFRENAPSEQLRLHGTTPDEQALLFLVRNFQRNTNVASYSPNIPTAARMGYVELTGINTRSEVQSVRDLLRWTAENNVSVFYVDDLLRTLEPALWNLVESQIGDTASVIFSSESPYIRILRVSGNPEADTKSGSSEPR
jgi:hypothetical protein